MKSSEQAAKTQMLVIILDHLDHGSYDEIMRELGFYRLVDRALAQRSRGRRATTEEIRQRVRTWHG